MPYGPVGTVGQLCLTSCPARLVVGVVIWASWVLWDGWSRVLGAAEPSRAGHVCEAEGGAALHLCVLQSGPHENCTSSQQLPRALNRALSPGQLPLTQFAEGMRRDPAQGTVPAETDCVSPAHTHVPLFPP